MSSLLRLSEDAQHKALALLVHREWGATLDRVTAIAPGLGNYYHIDVDEVLHAGDGRSFEDGSASWVPLGDDPLPGELAAHAAGYTLGNLHPDFSTTGANAGDLGGAFRGVQ